MESVSRLVWWFDTQSYSSVCSCSGWYHCIELALQCKHKAEIVRSMRHTGEFASVRGRARRGWCVGGISTENSVVDLPYSFLLTFLTLRTLIVHSSLSPRHVLRVRTYRHATQVEISTRARSVRACANPHPTATSFAG